MKKYLLVLYIVLSLLVILFFIRLFSHIEIDDVTPGIQCDENLIDRSDILWVIPIFDNNSIANNSEWCSEIAGKNKTLGLHGVYHIYKEFSYKRNDSYLEKGIVAFESCFNQTPTMFKPPQLAFTNENNDLLKRHDLKYHGNFGQLFHKVYHCSDTGRFPNWFIRIF